MKEIALRQARSLETDAMAIGYMNEKELKEYMDDLIRRRIIAENRENKDTCL